MLLLRVYISGLEKNIFQPVLVQTDHRALEHWVTELVYKLGAPRGRGGVGMRFCPNSISPSNSFQGKTTLLQMLCQGVATTKQDISWHGSAIAKMMPKSKFPRNLQRFGNLGHSHI